MPKFAAKLDSYFSLREEVFAYFGYVEDWRILPLDDCRDAYWQLNGEGPGEVVYGYTIDAVVFRKGDHYSSEIYTQRYLPKWVYRAEEYTMIVVDTHIDGNQLLMIFDNAKEVVELD